MLNINSLLKNNFHILINLLLILTVYVGFSFDENITGGPKLDFYHALKQVTSFSKDFYFTFFNYDKIETSTRISPIFTSSLYLTIDFFGDVNIARFFLLNVLLLNQYFFFKCLCISTLKYNFDKKTLLILSSVIYLSPSFRANIIWPESAMFGLLFFLISLLYYLKFRIHPKLKYSLMNIFFLALSAYVRPSYCLFAIFFFYKFSMHYFFVNKSIRNIVIITFINLILSLPAFFYVFILDIFFIDYGGLSKNYFNKISIISTIIFFHMVPVAFFYKNQIKFNIKKDIMIFLFILLTLFFIASNFDYQLSYAGGGIILHISNYLFNNNYLFYIFFLISTFYILKIIFLNKIDNFLIISILFLLTPQYHIFHKYYDPLVIILSLTCINFGNIKINYNNQKFLIMIYIFYIFLNLAHMFNNKFV